MAYSQDEKETTCVFDYVSKEWNVYTSVPGHITKLCRIGEPYWKETEPDKYGKPRIIAGKWKLGKSQVRFAKVIERLATDDENEDIESDEEVEEAS